MQYVKQKLIVLQNQEGQENLALQTWQVSFYLLRSAREAACWWWRKTVIVQVSGGPIQEDPTVRISYTAKMGMMSESKILFKTM